jgi:hypothetical protein
MTRYMADMARHAKKTIRILTYIVFFVHLCFICTVLTESFSVDVAAMDLFLSEITNIFIHAL